MLRNILFITIVLITVSCVKDKPQNPVQPQVQLSNNKKVYIVNEGNFMSSNSSVSLYDPGNLQVIENFYSTQNNNAVLGDVAQSINYFNSGFYIVVNNSNKIVVCDNQFKYKTVINGFTSPRYILPVSNSKAYVSDLYSNNIKVVNLNLNSVTSSIPCQGWTEQMALVYNKAYVTNLKKNFLYVINTLTDQKTDSISIGPNAGSLTVDKFDKVWVLSAGDKTASIAPTLRKIDPLTNQVETTLTFPLLDSPGSLCINKTKDTLYYLNGGIFRMPVNSASIPSTAFIDKVNKTFYGLGINPNDYTIYASDALDYIQKSNIYVYDMNANQKTFFKAGTNANSFYFE